MKTLMPLAFLLFIGFAAQARETRSEVLPQAMKVDVVLQLGTVDVAPTDQGLEVARLYRFRNSTVKKALTFATKRDRAMWA